MTQTTSAAAFALGLLASSTGPAWAETASPWVRESAAQLRLVDGGPGSWPGQRLAAIAIRLDTGWKTYWRQPGDSGVPPQFDFSGSENLASATVSYPAPERAADADGVTNVYRGEVVLPVVVVPRDASRPVVLALVADYGVCDKVCVPVHAETRLTLTPGAKVAGPAAASVRRAAEATPKSSPLGADAPLAILSVRRGPDAGGKATIEIVARAPGGGARAILFAETGEGGFAPAPEAMEAASQEEPRFRIVFDEASPPVSGLRLTLVGGGRAIETAAALDAAAATP